MLDFDSEDIDGMDEDAREAPESLGRGTTTLSHDIYMVDTPNKDDSDNPEDKTPGQKPKRRRRRRSKSSNCKNSDKSARRVDIPVNPEGSNDHMDPAMEQDEPGHAKPSSKQIPDHTDPAGRAETAPGQEHSPEDDAFINPEERVERENLHRKLIATARSLKKQKQRLKAAQETLNRRWNKVLDTE